MAVNPMQRKARNSFLLGVVITLLLSGVIIVLLFLQLKQMKEEQAKELALKRNVYVLNQDIKSGQVLTSDMFEIKSVNLDTIPSNATSDMMDIEAWYFQTKDGEQLCTDETGLYLAKSDNIIEITQRDGEYYKNVDGQEEKTSLKSDPVLDEEGAFIVDKEAEDRITRVYQEGATGNYYIYKLETTTINTNNPSRTKVYLEINNVPVVAKLDLMQNTVITPDLVVQSDEVITDDVREEQFNMIILPSDLMTDDYVDIRLMLPNGQNFIVVSKTKIEVPTNADGSYIVDTINVNLREDEILAMSSAIVEAYGIQGAKLYATKYTEPGMQSAAIPTYTPNKETTALIDADPNIVQKAKTELAARYTEAAKRIRNEYIQSTINGQETYNPNIQSGMDQSIVRDQEIRKEYLESLESLAN